jgi:uncharacterized membrane protein YbhN (UPF0104 family)
MTKSGKRRKVNTIRFMKRKLKPILSVTLVSLALAFCIYYLVKHHSLFKQLVHTPIWVIIGVLSLYTVMFGVLLLILSASINICNKKLIQRENAQLNAHSLFINFFIPGQGGPVYRGVYLYKKHNLKIKNYLVATVLYYVFYAMVSIFLLLVFIRPWWQTAIVTIALGACGILAASKYSGRLKVKRDSLNLSSKALFYLFIVTVLQAAVQAAIYAMELHSVNSHITFTQVVTYTGAANLALFVGLTPGAIGIRESFLIFTEHLHHISSSNIIVANVIDRSVYLAFLIILLAATIALQVRGKFQFRNLPLLVRQAFGLKPATATSSARRR